MTDDKAQVEDVKTWLRNLGCSEAAVEEINDAIFKSARRTDALQTETDKLSGEVERLSEEITEADVPDIVEAGRLGAKLSPAEQAAWTGYELGWRDGARDHGNELAAMDREARGYADMAEAADLRAEAAEAERDKLSAVAHHSAPVGEDAEVNRIAQELDVSPARVRKGLDNLKAKGLIRDAPPATPTSAPVEDK